MQPPDLQALRSKWVNELRLQDRIITVRYVAGLCDPTGNLVYGLMTIENLDEGRFLIEVQDPSTWPAGGSRELSSQSIEECLVHELVHIRWIDVTAYNPNPASIVQEERATWSTAQALIRANSQQRAAIVRGMLAKSSTPKRAFARRNQMIDAATAKQILDALQGDDMEAMKLALRGIVEAALTGGENGAPSTPEPGAPPAGQDTGMGKPDEKDKMPPEYMRSMSTNLASIRSMHAEITKYRDEAKTAADMLRPEAKQALIRGMRADGVNLTPHSEKLILDAPTLEEAKTLEKGMRAMAGPPGKPPPRPPNSASTLTRAQQKDHDAIARTNPARAEIFRSECERENAAKKGGDK